MIKFNELRISPKGDKIIIDISVRDLPYYKDIYLDKIVIDTQDTFISSGASENNIYSKTIEGNNKNYRLELDASNILTNFKLNLYFIYVSTKGSPTIDTPCGQDNKTVVGVTLYTCNIYNYIMSNIKELDKDCKVPINFINTFLRYKAFEIAIESRHYVEAIKFYNKFIKDIKQSKVLTYNCKCNE